MSAQCISPQPASPAPSTSTAMHMQTCSSSLQMVVMRQTLTCPLSRNILLRQVLIALKHFGHVRRIWGHVRAQREIHCIHAAVEIQVSCCHGAHSIEKHVFIETTGAKKHSPVLLQLQRCCMNNAPTAAIYILATFSHLCGHL